jgi:hypothetical protein
VGRAWYTDALRFSLPSLAIVEILANVNATNLGERTLVTVNSGVKSSFETSKRS